MKINSYAVGMSSTSVSMKSYTVTEKTVLNAGNGAVPGKLGAAFLTLSQEGRGQSASKSGNPAVSAAKRPTDAGYANPAEMKLFLIERLLGAMTGKKYNFRMFDRFNLNNGQTPFHNILQPQQSIQLPTGVTTERTESYYEFQQMSFEAEGIVNTADGRQIRFDLSVTASYEFASSSTAVIEGGKLCDPLVINFDGALPQFTKDRYAFDITIDGHNENIYMPTNGSGFLALDKNGNGKIDDGSELFGASSGDGFWELSAYDSDGNGWIDEGDEVFSQLQIMSVDRDTGEFVMVSLKDSGVGAIFLGSAKCNYEIKGDGNELMGVVRKNGVFLNEDGSAGTIQHIDLAY